jgi:membrane-associated protease RseP (regulator of RpoE activity)
MLDLLIFVGFLAALGIIVYLDRKKIEFQGIIIMRRTKRGVKALDSSAKKAPRFWRGFSATAVVVAIIAMVAGFALISYIDYKIAVGEIKVGGGFVLPYPTVEPVIGVGYVLLPIWLWILAIPILMVPHEFSHGVISRVEKIRVKSVGWILLLFIPGAFVEPDEKQLKKSSIMRKLRIYSVGSFANFLTAALFFVIGFLIASNFYTIAGVTPAGIVPDSPAAKVNMSGSILYIDGQRILTPDNISYVLKGIPIGSNITIMTTTGTFNITTAKNSETNVSFIGLQGPYTAHTDVKPEVSGLKGTFDFTLFLMTWLVTLTFSVGLVNLLPIKPLDGGLIFETLTGKVIKNESRNKKLVLVVTLITVALLGFFIFGGFLVK